jgi:hypothetical protein
VLPRSLQRGDDRLAFIADDVRGFVIALLVLGNTSKVIG